MEKDGLNSPLISIITVCYNEADRIIETCESIVNQSFQNFEWIVLDGGSTDGTVEILSRFRDRMSFFRTGPDGGIYRAMNEGIAHAKGEYCMFLNGGDSLFSEEALEAVVPFAGPGSDVIVGDIWFHESQKRPFYPRKVNLLSLVIFGLPHQSSVIRTALIKAPNNYDETFKIGADLDLFFRLRKKAGVLFVRVPAIVSRFHLDGVSSRNALRAWQDALDVYRKNLLPWQFLLYVSLIRKLWAYSLRIKDRLVR